MKNIALSRRFTSEVRWAAYLSFGVLAACGPAEDAQGPTFDSIAEQHQELSGRTPTLTTATPNSGPDYGGLNITLVGKNFRSGAQVSFGGVNASYVNVNSTTSMSVGLPKNPGAFGLVNVRITNPDGRYVERSDLFSYYSDKIAWRMPGRQGLPLSPYSAALADFNGDGKLDAVVAGNFGGLRVLLGTGDGEFSFSADYPSTSGPNSVIIAQDIDEDGKIDIVLPNYMTQIFLGNGDGSFRPGPYVPPGGGGASEFTEIGDFAERESDLKSEIISGNRYSNYVVVSSLDSSNSTSLDTGLPDIWGLHLADLDNDGKKDLALLSNATAMVSVLRHDYRGYPEPPILTDTIAQPTDFALADLNGDGKLDLVVGTSAGKVAVQLGNGDRTFRTVTAYVASNDPITRIYAKDLNGDGKVDVYVQSYRQSDPATGAPGQSGLNVLFGKGDGTLGAVVTTTTSEYLANGLVGDLTGDGKADALFLTQGSSSFDAGGIDVRVNLGNGIFQDRQAIPVGASPGAVIAGDWNGDGKADLAVANFSANKLSVMFGNNIQVFPSTVALTVGSGPAALARGDFNGDGRIDLVSANYDSGTVSLLLNNGDGTFQSQRIFSVGRGPISLVAVDLNADGKLDLAVANTDSSNVSVLLNNGTGGFAAAVQYALGKAPTGIAAGDVSGDGRVDLMTANADGASLSLLQQTATNPPGRFNAAKTIAVVGSPTMIALADLNSDGKLDVVYSDPDAGALKAQLNTGSGTFAAPTVALTCALPTEFGVVDLNNDGKLDLAAGCDGDATIRVAVNFGTGQFFMAEQSPRRAGPGPITIADLDGDTKPDLVYLNEISGTAGILLNRPRY